MRATSLIVTLFGDVVSQHGGVIWLGSLVAALAPFGVNERLVRTSVFRLVKDGWLESHKVGRKSYYQFTPYGLHEYQRAAHRIYDQEEHRWGGNWQLIIPRDLPEDRREAFRKSLYWQGFRNIAVGVFARCEEDNDELLATIEEFGVSDQVILFKAKTEAISAGRVTHELVQDCWKLDDVASKYRSFIKLYKSLHKWLSKHQASPESAFIARTLVIHDYRRVLLQDTQLPTELLPPAWPGTEAKLLAGEMYQLLAAPSIEYITSYLDNGNGTMPAAAQGFQSRFAAAMYTDRNQSRT
jgi:phenylacetic acid degradation operon negative regulatory protein